MTNESMEQAIMYRISQSLFNYCYSAHFTCAAVDCFNNPGPGCYLKNTPGECCGGPEVCRK